MTSAAVHILFLALAQVAVAQIAPARAKTGTHPRTPWGDPDLQGVWTGTEMIGVPVQRPASMGERAVLSDEEFARRVSTRREQEEFDTTEFFSGKLRCDPNRGGLGNTPDTCANGVSLGPSLYDALTGARAQEAGAR
jgi:hypothetical protein